MIRVTRSSRKACLGTLLIVCLLLVQPALGQFVFHSEGTTTITHDPDTSDGSIEALTNTAIGVPLLGNQPAGSGIQFVGLPATGTPTVQHDTLHSVTMAPDTADTRAVGGIGYEALPNNAGIAFRAGGGINQSDPGNLLGGSSSLRYDFDVTVQATANFVGTSAEVQFNIIGGIPVAGEVKAHWQFNYTDPNTGAPYIIGADYQNLNGLVLAPGPATPGAITGDFVWNMPTGAGTFSQNVFVPDLFVAPPPNFLLCANSLIRMQGFFELEAENGGAPVFIRTLMPGDPGFQTDLVNGSGMMGMPLPSPPAGSAGDGDGSHASPPAGIANGDFNHDCLLDQPDIDLLRDAILAATSNGEFNVDGANNPTVPDSNDFDFMITDILSTGFGDGNLDKVVNFEDFVFISNNFGSPGTGWLTGNFNLDTLTNFEDFVLLSNNFGVTFPSGSDESAVPEPTSWVVLMVGGVLGLRCRLPARGVAWGIASSCCTGHF